MGGGTPIIKGGFNLAISRLRGHWRIVNLNNKLSYDHLGRPPCQAAVHRRRADPRLTLWAQRRSGQAQALAIKTRRYRVLISGRKGGRITSIGDSRHLSCPDWRLSLQPLRFLPEQGICGHFSGNEMC
jgi:hypothetical protein